jgi:NAD(P)-dependent dehydrogenase (short-subunit alcohol dehydrogenase family)
VSARLQQLFDMSGRVAIVTGAGGILGPQFSAALAEFGARVALVDRSPEACQSAAAAIRSEFGTDTLALTADVSQETQIAAAVAAVMQAWGRVDVLVNAAASKSPGYFRPLAEYALEDWQQVMGVNLTGMFLATKHVVPHLIAQGKGSIVNIASIYGVVGPDPSLYEGSLYEGQPINTPPIYAASKGGVVNFTRYLATTLATHGIRANAISPGGVFSGQNDEFTRRYGERAPLGRMAKREEMKGALLYLASDASSYVTGHNLVVDGGWTAR